MPRPSPGVSELDARLAEIDRRLQEIQAGLAPDVDPALRSRLEARPPPTQFVSAGPFVALEEVAAFARTLASLDAVREATVRGYEGTDHAVIEVRLANSSG